MNELMNICSKCDTGFPLEENVCPNCGSTEFTKLVRSDTMVGIYESKSRKKKMIIMLLVCFAVVIALILYAVIRVSIETNS